MILLKNQNFLHTSDKFRINFDELLSFYYKQKIPGYIHHAFLRPTGVKTILIYH